MQERCGINIKCGRCYQFSWCMLTELMSDVCLGPFYNHYDALYKIHKEFYGRLDVKAPERRYVKKSLEKIIERKEVKKVNEKNS